MKKYLSMAATILAGATLMLATASAEAGPVHVDLSVGIPLPVFVQPGPVYVQPRPVVVYSNPGWYPQPWHDREWHDREWHEHHEWHDRDHHGHDRDWH